MRTLVFLALLGTATLLPVAPAAERVFQVTGTVRAEHAGDSILIEHEDIPGFMPAMTMPFYATAQDTRHLRTGDRVQFKFTVGERSRASDFRILDRKSASRERAAPPIGAKRLRPGDAVPDFLLTDEQERPFTGASLDGQFTLLTFVFTRCPVPEFCPRLAEKFASIQAQLERGEQKPVKLVSITIDPEHDSPAVLRQYGNAVGANPQHWIFATGSPSEIQRLTRLFAVRAEQEGSTINHTLATALIGPDRRVLEIWRGNGWKPVDVIASVPE